jgi:hypothetical protein
MLSINRITLDRAGTRKKGISSRQRLLDILSIMVSKRAGFFAQRKVCTGQIV